MSETRETFHKGEGGHEGNSGWWRNRVIAPARRFYNDPPDDLNAFFWINFVLPVAYFYLVSRNLSEIILLAHSFIAAPGGGIPAVVWESALIGALRLLAFAGIQYLNLRAARRFRTRRRFFLTIFWLNFLSLILPIPGVIPCLFLLPSLPAVLGQLVEFARIGTLSFEGVLLFILTRSVYT
ncbi:hypothetical protein V6767_06135 [Martelella sp. FLE1502]